MISNNNVLKFNARKKIYNFVDSNPGLNIRELSRRLNIPKTTLTYHLRHLKKLDLIKEKSNGIYKRIYIIDKISSRDKEILSLLREKVPRRIFLKLIFSLAFSQKDLCKDLELKPAKVSYHIKKLLDMGIIEEVPLRDGRIYPFKNPKRPEFINVYIKRYPVGTEKFYVRKTQEIIDETYRVLIKYKSSIKDEDIIDDYLVYYNFIDDVVTGIIKSGKKISNNFGTSNKGIDDAIDFITKEFLMPPFVR